MSETHVLPERQKAQGADKDRDTAATRHMCAGVYFHRGFRDRIIRSVHNAPYWRVAPSYGFDLVPVVRHAWYAWGLDNALLVCVPTVLTCAVLLGHALAAVMAGCVLASGVLLRFTVLTGYDTLRLRVDRTAENWLEREKKGRSGGYLDHEKRKRRLRGIRIGAAGIAAVLLVACMVADQRPEEALGTLGAVLGVLAAAGLLAGAARQLLINRVHGRAELKASRLLPREKAVDEQQKHHCAVYRRWERKAGDDVLDVLRNREEMTLFAGCGELAHYWPSPLTVPLLREEDEKRQYRRREYERPPFAAHELVDHLKQAFRSLEDDAEDVRLEGIEASDRLCVPEIAVSADRTLLKERLREEDLGAVIDRPRGSVRHYLEVTVPTEGGELFTTVLVAVTVEGRALSIGFSACALGRTPKAFHRIDSYAEVGKAAVVWSALKGAAELFTEAWRVIRLLELPFTVAAALWAQKDRTLRPVRWIPVGTRFSAREEAAQEWRDVGKGDQEAVFARTKVVEQRIVSTVEDFLEEKGVDTSEFSEAAVRIINKGVFNMGDNNQTNYASGRNSQVNSGQGEQNPGGDEQRKKD
ncbi:hypothetical protein [Nocardiopsis potens]|uniref:hypothetical protein n=1 Tax=Nocardiopsis potens TaxID=1246458 RepID=UPI0003493D24|nr:hypothetical protein [Nocardiopsis potens]